MRTMPGVCLRERAMREVHKVKAVLEGIVATFWRTRPLRRKSDCYRCNNLVAAGIAAGIRYIWTLALWLTRKLKKDELCGAIKEIVGWLCSIVREQE